MAKPDMSQSYCCTVDLDPLKLSNSGDKLRFAPAKFSTINAIKSPNPVVDDVSLTKGALVAIGYWQNEHPKFRAIGSGFLVGPGLIVSAAHILESELQKIIKGEVTVIAVGLANGEAVMWRVDHLNWPHEDDLAILSTQRISKVPKDRVIHHITLAPSPPPVGSIVELFGFRAFEGDADADLRLLAARGKVTEFYPNGRDSVMYPFPVIEIAAGSVGGMSGGVCLDRNGMAVGLITGSMETNDNGGPTYVSWLGPALNRSAKIVWPKIKNLASVSLMQLVEDGFSFKPS